jgi:opacity protein-like surface antigen
LNSIAGLTAGSNGSAIVFTGTVFGSIALDQVYYVESIVGSTITVSLTRGGTALSLTNSSGTMSVVVQTQPLFVSVNGTLITDNNYAVTGTTLNVYQSLTAGDIINASGSQFVLIETLIGPDNLTIGEQYGYSLDTNNYGTEILIGSPFQVTSQVLEGAVYRYTDGGGKYGIITGLLDCQVTTPTTILLNGYAAAIPAGNASVVANAIASANITNVTATAINNKLVISTGQLMLVEADPTHLEAVFTPQQRILIKILP